jgi:putative chitinase
MNLEIFFDGYRRAWGDLNQSQVDGLDFLLPRLEADERLGDVRQRAYVFATTKWEAANTWQPIAERGTKRYKGIVFASHQDYFNYRYGNRADLGNKGFPNAGWLFRGRGYCQITGRANYLRFSELLGVDLVVNPDLALVPEHAYEILVRGMKDGLFTGKGLDRYIRGNTCNYLFARQIVNRMDKAPEIARIAARAEGIFRAAA